MFLKKKVGRFQEGQIVDDSDLRIRRLIQEGDCLKRYKAEKKEDKMQKMNYENKQEGGK